MQVMHSNQFLSHDAMHKSGISGQPVSVSLSICHIRVL